MASLAVEPAPRDAAQVRWRRLRWSAGAAAVGLGVAVMSLLDTWSGQRATREALTRLSAARATTPDPPPLLLLPVAPSAGLPRGPIVLGDFETDGALARWVGGDGVEAIIVPAPERPGEHAAQVGFPARSVEGFILSGLPRDWRPFATLALDVYVAKSRQDLELGVRVDDRLTDPRLESRYEVGIRLGPGWNALRLPVDVLARAVDPTAITRIVLYARGARGGAAARTLVIDRVRLEPRH